MGIGFVCNERKSENKNSRLDQRIISHSPAHLELTIISIYTGTTLAQNIKRLITAFHVFGDSSNDDEDMLNYRIVPFSF